jgi:hypothetical protein
MTQDRISRLDAGTHIAGRRLELCTASFKPVLTANSIASASSSNLVPFDLLRTQY